MLWNWVNISFFITNHCNYILIVCYVHPTSISTYSNQTWHCRTPTPVTFLSHYYIQMTDIDTPFLKHNLCMNMFLSVGYVEQAEAFLISHLIEILLHPCTACCKFYHRSPCFFFFFLLPIGSLSLIILASTFFSIIILSTLSSTSRVRTAKFSPAPNTLESRSCVAFLLLLLF